MIIFSPVEFEPFSISVALQSSNPLSALTVQSLLFRVRVSPINSSPLPWLNVMLEAIVISESKTSVESNCMDERGAMSISRISISDREVEEGDLRYTLALDNSDTDEACGA